MSGKHARPSRPGRAVLLLAAVGLMPPALVLGPRAVAVSVSVPDVDQEDGPLQADWYRLANQGVSGGR